MDESEGGLATGLASLSSQFTKQWIGWPGIHAKNEVHREEIIAKMDATYHPVFLDQKEIDLYYKGFSNETIWPLFHYFMKYTQYKNEYWNAYVEVNKKFCDEVVKVAKEGDIIWVHDYHLMLLPHMLREKLEHKNPIGFFLHIPFVSYELFRTLPWRKQLLQGLLGSDLVGFHTFEYMRHFIDTSYRVLGVESRLGAINFEGRLCYADTFPMGISFEKFHQASESEDVIGQLRLFKEKFGNVKLILSVDRLDYTKGIINRLKAFDCLLQDHPELKGTISLIMLTVPSRDNVSEYKNLKEEVDELVGNMNGKYSTLTWTAVHYLYRSVSFEELVALYNLADIGLVTPLRDGMNLVAKEFVASKNHGNGVLILSEMAGSAIELEGALRINPNDQNAMVDAMYKALLMDSIEQEQRLKKMQQQVRIHSVEKWGADFTDQLTAIYEQARKNEKVIVNGKETAEICASFTESEDRLIVLDYDGTLAPFHNNPYDSKPAPELKTLIQQLSKHATIVLLSGRDHFTMDEWFGDYGIQLIAEHGIWHKCDGEWKQSRELSSAWKTELYPVLESFIEKTPGSSIEEKPFSLVFHYRRSDSWLSEIRVPQLMNILAPLCKEQALDIVDGNKVVEIRIPGIDKGTAAQKWLSHHNWDFIMCVGDDKTDEDMFAVMPEQAYTIKVGAQPSKAKMRIKNCDKVVELLEHMLTFITRKNDMKLLYGRNSVA
jgi:trehalose 6-phosphate synthase/phosphatase